MKRLLLHPLRAFRLHRLDALRERLPMDDPDRHALDVVADARFAALAPGHPNLETSRRYGFESPITWGEQPPNRRPAGYTSPDCEPAWAPKKPVVDAQDVQTTGGVL